MKAPRSYEASTDYSPQHFFTAELFASLASEIESRGNGAASADSLHRHQAYVSGAIFASVAFLEAYVNELFQHCYESPAMILSMGLNQEQVQVLAQEWMRGVPRTAKYRVTQKYDVALELLVAEPFDHGATPYQDVSLLVMIRNKLVHYEPDTFPIPGPLRPEVPTEEISALEKRLRGKFLANSLSHEERAYFPDRCLGAGCANWAVQQSEQFVVNFGAKAGIEKHFKGDLARRQAHRTHRFTGNARHTRSFWEI